MTAPYVPHLAIPLLIGPGGSFNTLAQDSLAEVAQSVQVLLGTIQGERSMIPTYGIADPPFTEPDPDSLVGAIALWEPRADPTITVTYDGAGEAHIAVQVAVAQPES